MRRPLIPVVLIYAGGLLVAEILNLPLAILFLLSFATLLLALISAAHRLIWLGALIFLTGWTNSRLSTAVISPDDLRLVLGDQPQLVTVRGKVLESPGVRVTTRHESEMTRSQVRLAVQSIKLGGKTRDAIGTMLVSTLNDAGTNVFTGQIVEVYGIAERPPGSLAEGLFDYQNHLRRRGIYFILKAASPADWNVISTSLSPPLADRFREFARRTLGRGLPVQDQELQLLWAMTLGWKTALTDEVSEPFMRSGTMHIFAISGLHIALIAAILLVLLRVLRLNRLGCGAAVIPLLWFYTAATGWQPSAIRSTIMVTIIIGGWALKRPSDLLNSLAGAAFVILLWQPQQLFQISFQLSFFVVLSIALMLPPLEKARDTMLKNDPMLPRQLLPNWRRAVETPLRWLTTSFATSLAAWLGSLPLTATYFHLFTPVTLVANLLIVPLSAAAIASAMASLLCGWWWPWLGAIFNHSAWFWIHQMLQTSHWASDVPGAYWYVATLPYWSVLTYYMLLFASLGAGVLSQLARRLIIAACVGVVALLGFREWRVQRATTELFVLPLSGGHAVYVDAPGTANDWLVDCGDTNAVEGITAPFLRAHGVNRLPQLLLTHGDIQQMGGAASLLETFRGNRVFTSDIRFRSTAYRDFIDGLEHSQALHQTVELGDAISPWQVLHPPRGLAPAQADDGSIVLLGTFNSTRVLLLGDLGRPGQEALLTSGLDCRADILVSGLPGRSEAVSDALIAAVSPQLIIVADSEYPASQRASPALRHRLGLNSIPVLYTRKTRALKIVLTESGWSIQHNDTSDSYADLFPD